jgi:hypothetical protein
LLPLPPLGIYRTDFYNAAGVNEYGKAAEESGFATLPLSEIPGAGNAIFIYAKNDRFTKTGSDKHKETLRKRGVFLRD